MYENIFTYSFLPNFFFSLLFLIFNILFSYKISDIKIIKERFFFEKLQPIVIFYLIFILYTFVLNLIVIFNFEYLSEIFYFFLIIQIIFLLKDFRLDTSFSYTKNFDEKLTFIILIIFLLISILPLSDADSIAVYQYLPSTIFNEGLNNIDLKKNLEFTLLSNAEILLLISPILKSDNFGAQLNLITLFFFILISFKNHKNFFFIVISSPLIIYFISTQKLQLFYGILFLLSFILFNKSLVKTKSEFFIFILLLTFYSSGKISYILFSIPIFLYFFYFNQRHWQTILISSLASFILVYLPILFLKSYYFENSFAPFFDNLLGKGLESYNAFVYSIRNSEGWISNPTDIFLYLRPFISFDISSLSSSLGLIFLLMLFDFKIHKQTRYIPVILIILVLTTGQILPRYYFEAFLILAYFYKPKKLLLKLFIFSQISIILLISLAYIYLAYFKYDVINNKVKYMNRFSYSHFNSNQLKKDSLKGNVLDFTLDRQSIFFDKSIYSIRYLSILNNFNNNDDENFRKFVLNNDIKYLIIDEDTYVPMCLNTNEIKKTQRTKAVRNIFLNPDIKDYKLLKIQKNECNSDK